MVKRTTLTACALVATLLAGCAGSDGADEAPVAREPAEQAQAQPGKAKRAATRRARKEARRAARKPRAATAPATRRAPSGGDAGERRVAGTARRRAAARPRTRMFPAGGTYRYRQTGYEDFCQAASCTREQLPPTQVIAQRVLAASGSSATLASEERGSPYRSVHTRWVYTPRSALITQLSFRVRYQGFGYSRGYRPRPAIVSLRFPLTPGRQWAGRWAAQTSGSYRARVVEVAPVRAAGKTIRAAKVVTTTYLRGELKGRADLTAWIDSNTRAIVQTLGRVDVTSSFGRYVSEFHTLLASAPGY